MTCINSVYPRYSYSMNIVQFLQNLKETGYPEPVEVEKPPHGHANHHTHSFAVKALIVAGDIAIETAGETKKYIVGDVFELDFEELHAEHYGPQGVKYLASRKS